jgi:hypothetical protein
MRGAYLLLALTTACSPFSPSLGQTPFLCNPDSEPKCPDGYSCTPIGMQNVCVKNGTVPPDAPDPNRPCYPDMGIETANGSNNDSLTTAYPTPVATTRNDADLAGAICPAGDLDYFSIQLTATQSIELTLTYQDWGAVLQGELENSGGGRLVQLSPMTGVERTMHAKVSGLTSAQYYVKVSGPNVMGMEGRNNYDLKIVVTTP